MSLDEQIIAAKKQLDIEKQEALKNVIEWAKEFVKRVKENIMRIAKSFVSAFNKFYKPGIIEFINKNTTPKRISYRQSIRSHIEKKGKNRINITNLRPTT